MPAEIGMAVLLVAFYCRCLRALVGGFLRLRLPLSISRSSARREVSKLSRGIFRRNANAAN
jgi:hypothetical protein